MRLIGVAYCLSLLLLLLLFLLKTSPASSSDGSVKFQSSKSQPIPFQAKPGFTNKKTHKGDGIEGHGSEVAPAFGDEKRKIYTGPNPLHNR